MVLSINNNTSARRTGFWTEQNWQKLQKSLERLSSGLRINRASDDPAGLVISEQLRSRVASLNQEIENTSALIMKYDTASATVQEMRSQLTELRGLAVAASNEAVNSEAAQAAYETTANHLVASYNRVLDTATYNGWGLLDGSEQAVASIEHLEDVDFSDPDAVAASMEQIDDAMDELDEVQGELGATQKNELESRRRSMQVTAQNLTAAESLIRDTDYALEYSNLVASRMQLRASVALLSHSFVTANSVLTLLEASVND